MKIYRQRRFFGPSCGLDPDRVHPKTPSWQAVDISTVLCGILVVYLYPETVMISTSNTNIVSTNL